MSAWRCSMCGISWPPYSEYMMCPTCGEKSDYVGYGAEPIPLEEAQELRSEAITQRNRDAESRAKHAKFEKEYEDREVALLMNELDDWVLAG